MLFWRQCVDGMLPVDVDISAERKKHAVCLGEIDPLTCLRVKEGELTGCTEGNTDSDVLVFCAIRVEGGRVVVEGFPVGGASVPVKAGTD